jgi:fluoride exporter
LAIFKIDLAFLIVGAVTGTFLRYKVGSTPVFFGGIPLSILFINVLGSFILGLSMSTIQRFGLNQDYTLLLGVGFCGSFTTMSSFAYEAEGLLDGDKLFLGFLDIMLNVGLSIFAVYLGKTIIQYLFN